MNAPPRPDLTIAAAQSVSRWNDLDGNLETHLRLAERAAAAGADFLIFPELSLTGYPDTQPLLPIETSDGRLDPLRALCRRSNMFVVAGAPMEFQGKLAIAALIVARDGTITTQLKSHLHPGEERFFKAGFGGPPLRVRQADIAIAICAEASHRSHAEAALASGAGIYAVSALESETAYPDVERRNMGWARDLGLVILLANHGAQSGSYSSAGRSGLWTPTGKAATAPAHGEAVVIGRIRDGVCRGDVLL